VFARVVFSAFLQLFCYVLGHLEEKLPDFFHYLSSGLFASLAGFPSCLAGFLSYLLGSYDAGF
jgi:hypothetical protein